MPLAVLAAGLVAAALCFAFGPLKRQAVAERVVLSCGGAVLTLGVVSWLAMHVGVYTPWLIAPLLVLVTGGFFWAARRWGEAEPASAIPVAEERGGRLALALIVCFGALYVRHPTYFILGGQDPGLYFEFAVRIAKTGGLNLDLPWLRELGERYAQGGICFGYPGIYNFFERGVGNDPTRFGPQFVLLFPALAANAWAAGGLEATVCANAPLALLGLGFGFVLARRLAGFIAGLAFILVLGLNPAFVWGARITLTEVLAALLNLAGLVLLFFAAETRGRGWALTAGFVLGLGVFNRLDAGLSGLALLGFALSSVAEPARARSVRAAASIYLVTTCLGYVDAKVVSRFYFQALVERHHLRELMAISTVCALVAFAIGVFVARPKLHARLPRWSLPVLAYSVLSALVFWLVFALLVRPEYNHDSDARSARELGWYLTPIVWPLLVLGLALLLRRRDWGRGLPLLLFFSCALVIFTAEPHVAPEHIWASRRWLSHVIPLALLLAVVAADALVRFAARLRPLALATALGLGASYLVPALSFTGVFLFRTMNAGLPEAYTSLVERIRASNLKLPLVTGHPHLASILTYVYDVPTLLFGTPLQSKRGFTAESRRLLATGDFEGWDAVGLDVFEANATPSASSTYEGEYLEGAVGWRPRNVVVRRIGLNVGHIGGPRFEFDVPPQHPRFGSQVGVPGPDGSLKTTGVAGLLLHGPRIELVAGQYEVDWLGRVSSVGQDRGGQAAPQGTLEVVNNGMPLASMPLRVRPSASETWLGGLDFAAARDLTGVEFRLRVEGDVALELTRVRLRRVRVGAP